jgi:hypothetical protein
MVDPRQYGTDRWALRGALLREAAESVTALSTEFVRAAFARPGLLDTSQRFVAYDLMDIAPGHLEAQRRVWYFPWAEATGELDRCLSLACLGMYRGVYDHQRRALELAAVGAFFVSDHTPRQKALAWMRSDETTPIFSRTLEHLAKHGLAARLEAQVKWTEATVAHYRRLSDITHVRGERASSWKVQPRYGNVGGIAVPAFDKEALAACLNAYCDTVRHVALLLALANPIALFDVPVDAKFGLNAPLSGFIEGPQVERLRELLPDPVREPLIALADTYPEVLSVRRQIEEMPDISEAEMKEQIRWFNQMFGPPSDEWDA